MGAAIGQGDGPALSKAVGIFWSGLGVEHIGVHGERGMGVQVAPVDGLFFSGGCWRCKVHTAPHTVCGPSKS